MDFKLNVKRTFIIGFAFFTILMLWQIYNHYAPLFLKELFTDNYGAGDYNYLVGIIMALDNILALFMLPLFGMLSDKTKSRLGRRMPYIICGTLLALMVFPFIAIMFIKGSLVGVAIMMGIILITMNIYRAPSVALMPDVTPKPLRAKANAIINFVGYLGAMIGGLLAVIFTKTDALSERLIKQPTIWPFVITSFLMLVALIVLVLKIRENKIVSEMKQQMEQGENMSEAMGVIENNKPLSHADKVNLWLLIVSIFLWFFAFNSVETFGSTYANEVLGSAKSWGTAVIVISLSSLLTFLPSAYLSQKIGRKNSIIVGLILMVLSLGLAYFITSFNVVLYLLFAVAGCGWAIINVNSYPMFVELASSVNVGKFTGYYYVASQVAQSITPIAIGFVLDYIGLKAYFPYATLFMLLALLVFVFIKQKKITKP